MDILNGQWFTVNTQKEFETLQQYGDLDPEEGYEGRHSKGRWKGPGRYYVTSYLTRCGRGCCDEQVYVTRTLDEVQRECDKLVQETQKRVEEILAGH
jgi:hypothetical protein